MPRLPEARSSQPSIFERDRGCGPRLLAGKRVTVTKIENDLRSMVIDFWQTKRRAFARTLQEQGFWEALYQVLYYPWRIYNKRRSYARWLATHRLSATAIAQAQATVKTWEQPPIFSVLVPIYNPDPALLKRAIESVRQQIYPHWQLCLVDDGSPDPVVQQVLQTYAGVDERIRLQYLSENQGISEATNQAFAIATGDYIALLDHDDELSVDALYENALIIRQHPEVDVLYSDEDKITETGKRFQPFFKPDWSPDYFHATMYTCHLTVYRTALVRAVGGMRSAFNGSQDWDLMLRIVEKTQQIYHIPKVLYHWRVTSVSAAAGGTAKPWAYEAGKRALEAMLQRSAYAGWVESLQPLGLYRVHRQLAEYPLISIIIPSAGTLRADGQAHLVHCLKSIAQRSTYPNIELVVVDGFDIPQTVLEQIKAFSVQLVHCDRPFNFSMRINWGVQRSRGKVLLLLNDDVEVLAADWLESMLKLAQLPGVGAVGAKLLFPNGHLQHVGVVLPNGNPGHVFYDVAGDHPGYFGSNLVNRNYLAVTGACLMVQRSRFEQVNGLDEAFPLNYNDVDFCLKLHQAGYRNVVTPFAELVHHESASRQPKVLPAELAALRDRWLPYLTTLGGDPYYNINLNQAGANFEL